MTSTFYQMVLACVVILYQVRTRVLLGILEIFKHRSTCMDNDRIQWTLGTCMGPYFVYVQVVGSDFWVPEAPP